MNKVNVGDRLMIHCYKHDGNIHRTCDEATVLEVNDEMLVVANNKARITESDGRSYKTKEPAIIIFYKDKWFNIMGQLKSHGLFYYCNIASPYVIDNGIIKYIDYDLDLRVFPDGGFRVLDRNEYNYHKKKMGYSNEIDEIVKSELTTLIDMKKQETGPFSPSFIEKYYTIYKNL